MKRSIVIGDIHGALKALTELIQKINIQKDDRLIFLGDYVDGWPQSAATITYLMELGHNYECIFIKGNHDAWCEDWLNGKKPDETWLKHGGKATIDSYKNVNEKAIQTHREFFNRLRNYYIDDKNRLFIHAGFSSMHGPEKEMYASNFSWDRTLWEMALVMDKRIQKDSKLYPKRLLLYNEIYIGHTPTLNYDVDTPMQACNVWDIDTGAAFYGKLSALDIDTKEVWQSAPCFKLYPNDKGRN
ncbi:MAG: serine/threonine protein phosphatase [Ferruginibacter sp.]|nr:serine/threonine protein phosphatase [Ferruginibacter sp.]